MKSKHTKRGKNARRPSKSLLKLRMGGSLIDEAFQLESMLAKKPKKIHLDFVGVGEIPADSALLMRSILLKRPAQTRIITNARSSLIGPAVLIWLLGDTRHLREDAQLRFRAAGPFAADHAPVAWNERCTCDECQIEEADYLRVLEAINEFLPVRELAGQSIALPVLRQYGLVESAGLDALLAAAFQDKEKHPEPRHGLKEKLAEKPAQ